MERCGKGGDAQYERHNGDDRGGAELGVGKLGQCQGNAYGYANDAEETEAVRDAPLDG